MTHDSSDEKNQAHELIERLAPNQVSAVVGLLEAMVRPVSRAGARDTPTDDEPLTPEAEGALNQAREWLMHNTGIPHEQVLAELGITMEEIKRLKDPT